MSVSISSRYADGHYTRSFPNPRRYAQQRYSQGGYLGPVDATHPVILRTTIIQSSIGRSYRWVQGDRWDMVAERLGIPKTDWWILLDANPQIEFPMAMRPGDIVNVPDAFRRQNA